MTRAVTTGGGKPGQGYPCVITPESPVPTYCIQGNCIDRADTAGCNGKGWTEDVCYTLNTIDRPAVTQGIPLINDQGGASINVDENAVVSPTLRAETHGNLPIVAGFMYKQGAKAHGVGYAVDQAPTLSAERADASVVYDARGNGDGQICSTITGGHESTISDYTALVVKPPETYCMQGFGDYKESPTASACKMRDYKDSTDLIVYDRHRHYIVRRLTPTECERLQGYPDGWTDISEFTDKYGVAHPLKGWMDSREKWHKDADSPRYKALGNSIALPPWMYVLQKISLCCATDHTMASLFDGIGGFPFIWELFNGKGSCLWASEIEEFPIAVTKVHFPERSEAT